jgi:hypothetical protein
MWLPGMRYGCGCSALVVAALWFVLAWVWVTLDEEVDPLVMLLPLGFGLFVGGGLLVIGFVTDMLGLHLRRDDDSTDGSEPVAKDRTWHWPP